MGEGERKGNKPRAMPLVKGYLGNPVKVNKYFHNHLGALTFFKMTKISSLSHNNRKALVECNLSVVHAARPCFFKCRTAERHET